MIQPPPHLPPASLIHDAAYQSGGRRANAVLPGDRPEAVHGRDPPEERLGEAEGCPGGADLLQSLKAITSQPAGLEPVGTRAGGGSGTVGVPLIVSLTLKPSEDMYRLFISSTLGLDSAYKLLCADGQTEPVFITWKIRPSGESCSTLDYTW
ncbi:nocturnin-like [Oncorhynchus mykiss]|uniref:nocturnin-like n=1 Tax=Oncorhynchus mykiss TaxID=8022 RepID=UPI000B4F34CC|nr:nocturnin-like [Oncorhynchus mykiss]